jgi:chlorobactene glucosyltransferase
VTSLPLIAALPWLAIPFVLVWRMRGSPRLSDELALRDSESPLVSVVIPARNEARNIALCMQSVLRSHYPHVEVVVVDDRSTDGTGIIAREVSRNDKRARVIEAPPLPDGWLGKQWACSQGAAVARGEILCFTDADTIHGSELLTRSVAMLRNHGLDFVTVAGRQRLVSFWERVVQPHIFTMLALRYGGPGEVNRSTRVEDKIANGQFMLFTRAAYDEIGGHEAVRGRVAEDLALAQLLFERGKRTMVALGLNVLSTRMYGSLGEIVRGWMKNIYAGGLDAAPFGAAGRTILPLALLTMPVAMLAPVVVLVLAAVGRVSSSVLIWAAACTVIPLAGWAFSYVMAARFGPLYAFTFPLGAAVVMYIVIRAVSRGMRVEWKGREYQLR